MKLKEYIKAVKTLCVELHAEDMDSYETSALDNKIILAANMGARDLGSNTYPLIKSAKMDGPAEWVPSEDFLSLQNYEGGRAERFYNAEGKECLSLKEAGPYCITYRYLPKAVKGPEDTFEFPEHVMNALIYYGAYHVLSSDNDKRGFVYFKNLYDQACVNILANRPSKLTVVRAKRGGLHVL